MGLGMGKKLGCCCGEQEPVVQIGIGDESIGLVGLNKIFEQLRLLGRPPDPTVEEELLEMVAAKNYIPKSCEDEYRFALRREYAKYYAAKQTKQTTV